MRRARGFKEIQPINEVKPSDGSNPKKSRGFKEIQPIDQLRPSDGSSSRKSNKNIFVPSASNDDVLAPPPPPEAPGTVQVRMDEIFPPMGIPPLRTSHHPSVPCRDSESDELIDLNPFPFIYKSKYDFKFDNIKDRILKDTKRSKTIIEQTGIETPEKEGGLTTVMLTGSEIDGKRWKAPHEWPELDHFIHTWLPEKVREIYAAWNLSPHAIPYISESWTNEHSRGSFTEGHHHHNSQISLSCYLNVPKSSGRLMVKDPMETYNYSRPLGYNHEQFGKAWKYIEVDTNDVLFFPGWLEHQTERSESDDKRYIMSINISYFDIGAYYALNQKIIQPLWEPPKMAG